MKYQTNCHKISSKNRRSPSTSPMTFGDVPIKSKEKQGKNKQKRRSDPVSNENQNKIFEESKPANTLPKSLVKRKSLESNSVKPNIAQPSGPANTISVSRKSPENFAKPEPVKMTPEKKSQYEKSAIWENITKSLDKTPKELITQISKEPMELLGKCV